MYRNKLATYIHFVWTTWDREPLIAPAFERRLHRNIANQAIKMGCKVLSINGMEEHIHLVVKIPSTITIANLMKQVKGVSSHFVNHTVCPDYTFKWRGCYGAFTVSRWDLDKIINYVKNQKEHHNSDELYSEWEQSFIDDEFAPASAQVDAQHSSGV